MEKKRVLHLGCSNEPIRKGVFEQIYPDGWEELRIDIDPDCRADIVADVRNLEMFEDHSADAVYSAHLFEHFDSRERDNVMKEWLRVLRKGEGVLYMIVPRIDAESVIKALQEGNPEQVVYDSASGPVQAVHLLYGQWYKGEHEVHKWGYTRETLHNFLEKYLVDVHSTTEKHEVIAYGWTP